MIIGNDLKSHLIDMKMKVSREQRTNFNLSEISSRAPIRRNILEIQCILEYLLS